MQCDCQIGPSFSYFYTYIIVNSSGYYSHSEAQRTDGFFGALIIKERPELVETQLDIHGIRTFIDKSCRAFILNGIRRPLLIHYQKLMLVYKKYL